MINNRDADNYITKSITETINPKKKKSELEPITGVIGVKCDGTASLSNKNVVMNRNGYYKKIKKIPKSNSKEDTESPRNYDNKALNKIEFLKNHKNSEVFNELKLNYDLQNEQNIIDKNQEIFSGIKKQKDLSNSKVARNIFLVKDGHSGMPSYGHLNKASQWIAQSQNFAQYINNSYANKINPNGNINKNSNKDFFIDEKKKEKVFDGFGPWDGSANTSREEDISSIYIHNIHKATMETFDNDYTENEVIKIPDNEVPQPRQPLEKSNEKPIIEESENYFDCRIKKNRNFIEKFVPLITQKKVTKDN